MAVDGIKHLYILLQYTCEVAVMARTSHAANPVASLPWHPHLHFYLFRLHRYSTWTKPISRHTKFN